MSVLLIVCILLSFTYPQTVFAQPPVEHSMEFSVAEWAYEVRDEEDYDPNPDAAFPRGERAYAYLELTGFSLKKDGELWFHDLSVDVALKTKRGFRLFARKNILELVSWYEEIPESVWFYIYVDVPTLAPRGTYITEITVTDELSHAVLQEAREIEVY